MGEFAAAERRRIGTRIAFEQPPAVFGPRALRR
jgi:hypothetical protein